MTEQESTQERMARMDERIKADREWAARLADERDKRYSERDQANKSAVSAALQAVREATEKTEKRDEAYRISSNEWRGTLTDLTARMPSNKDVDQRFEDLKKDIADLKAAKDTGTGKSAGISTSWAVLLNVVGLVSLLAGVFLAMKGR